MKILCFPAQILVYCDLHGHSRKHNVFIYGCDKNGKEIDAAAFLYQRLFPWLMSREVGSMQANLIIMWVTSREVTFK